MAVSHSHDEKKENAAAQRKNGPKKNGPKNNSVHISPVPEKNRARGKTRQKKDKLNIAMFVMLNLHS